MTALVGNHSGSDVIVKWQPTVTGTSLADEAERMVWLQGRHPVPELVEHRSLDGAELLVTAALPTLSAVDGRWPTRGVDATRAIAEGLRRLHALDPVESPFDWTVEKRIGNALGQGIPLTRQLLIPPHVDQSVVCHGDACAPNTLVAADGSVAATVDLGAVGVEDRWADLAVATMSLGWNFDGELGSVFWETYGVVPDEERIRYYRDLWNAT